MAAELENDIRPPLARPTLPPLLAAIVEGTRQTRVSTPPAYTTEAASLRLQGLASLRQTVPSQAVLPSASPPAMGAPRADRIVGNMSVEEWGARDEVELIEMALAEQALSRNGEADDETSAESWSDTQQALLLEGRLDTNGEKVENRNDSLRSSSLTDQIGR